MSLIYLITKGFEDSLTCGCDTTDSVRYHLRANKIDLSLKEGIKDVRFIQINREGHRWPTIFSSHVIMRYYSLQI